MNTLPHHPLYRSTWFIGSAAASVLILFGNAAARTIEYSVTDLPMAPDADYTIPLAINDQGVVVGYAQYFGGDFYLRAWRWSADEGLTLLPPPPGDMFDRYGARDINNSGVILGDGGGDSGVAWKFENGTYTILGTLPYDPYNASVGAALNDLNVIVGSAFDANHFTVPDRAFIYTDATGLQELCPDLPATTAQDINQAGQVVVSAGSGTFRQEPDGTRTFLPTPPGFAGFTGLATNESGDIAGLANCSHECNQAALWTEATGYQIIPWVGTRHSVGGLNDSREVVGTVTEGVAYAWVWSPDLGLQLLAGLIDPGLTRNVFDAMDINNAGQIIALGYDYSDPLDPLRIMLLTPMISGDLDGDGSVGTADLLILLAAWGPCPAPPEPCPADLNGDGSVGTADLLILLAHWG